MIHTLLSMTLRVMTITTTVEMILIKTKHLSSNVTNTTTAPKATRQKWTTTPPMVRPLPCNQTLKISTKITP